MISRKTVWEKYLPTYWDPIGKALLDRMDDADIDQQAVFAIDWDVPLITKDTNL